MEEVYTAADGCRPEVFEKHYNFIMENYTGSYLEMMEGYLVTITLAVLLAEKLNIKCVPPVIEEEEDV